MSRLVVATHNLKKGGEMVTILSEGLPGWTILTLADFPGAPEPEETGTTYRENSIIKAESAAAFTGELCIADDAGLEIDALNGAPGVYSKRFGGEHLPFPEKIALILQKLHGLPEEKRGARFNCWVTLCQSSGSGSPSTLRGGGVGEGGSHFGSSREVSSHDSLRSQSAPRPPAPLPPGEGGSRILEVFNATCEGRIAEEPSGAGGFGYDPIFFLPERGCCMADLTAEEKHQVSHRGKVLRAVIERLKS